jgi:Flp pilus assembly protein TadD
MDLAETLADVHILLAAIMIRTGDEKAARAHLGAALTLAPNPDWTRNIIASYPELTMKRGHPDWDALLPP